MFHDIIFALWFLLPAGVANIAPVLSNVIPGFSRWQAPLDGGLTFRGKELFGKHKTWRGLVSGILAATLVFWLEQLAVSRFGWARFVAQGAPYQSSPTLLVGPLFGLGALGGDVIKSFFKRQRGVPSGGSWVPFDQMDYVIGAVVATLPFAVLTPWRYAWIAILWFGLHLAVSYLGWLLGLKSQPI